MNDSLIEIGQVINTRGLKGELKVRHWCDGAEDFLSYDEIFIDGAPREVISASEYRGFVYMRLKGVDDSGAAALLRDKIIRAKRRGLPDGVYYLRDLIGMSVYDRGEFIGTVRDRIVTGGADVYVIALRNGGEKLIPAIKQVINSVDVQSKAMQVTTMPEEADDY